MKYNLKVHSPDQTITHRFIVANKVAVISCNGEYGVEEEGDAAVYTQVCLGDNEPVDVAGFLVATPEDAKELSRVNTAALENAGIDRPSEIKSGAVIDIGADHNRGEIQLLCHQLKLDGDDITDYQYVDFSVRAAALALARKIIKKHHKKRRS